MLLAMYVKRAAIFNAIIRHNLENVSIRAGERRALQGEKRIKEAVGPP